MSPQSRRYGRHEVEGVRGSIAAAVGSLIQIQMLLGERALEPEGRIVRVEHVKRQDGYPLTLVAVEFVELAEETRKALAVFVRERHL